MNTKRSSTFVAAWFVVGFLILFTASSGIATYEFLTTPNFEGLYDMPKSQQTVRHWLSIQPAFLAGYFLAGVAGGCVALAGGLVGLRVRKREA